MMKKIAFLSTLSLLVASLAACENSDDLKPVKFAALLPMTGLLSEGGPAFHQSVTLAVEQINASGGVLNGRQLEFELHDSRTDPPYAAELGAQLLRDPDIVGIVGSATSSESLAMLDVANDVQKPILSCCATSTELAGKDDYFFRTTPNDALQARAIAKVVSEGRTVTNNAGAQEVLIDSCDQVGIVWEDGPYGESFRNSIVSLLGDEILFADVSYGANLTATDADDVISTVRNNFGALNITAQTSQICVVLLAFAPDGLKLANAINTSFDASIDVQLIGADGMNLPDIIREYSVNARPIYITAPSHAVNEAFDRFAIAMEARFGNPSQNPVGFSFNNFDATILLGLAMVSAGSTDGAEIKNALQDISRDGECRQGRFFGEIAQDLVNGVDINYSGPSGDLDLDENGDVVGNYGIFALSPAGDELLERDVIELPELVEPSFLETLSPCPAE